MSWVLALLLTQRKKSLYSKLIQKAKSIELLAATHSETWCGPAHRLDNRIVQLLEQISSCGYRQFCKKLVLQSRLEGEYQVLEEK